MRSILEAGDLRGKHVLLRVDFNVPVRNGAVLNDYRIKKSLPTIKHLKGEGAKIIILSHIASSNGNTLRPVFEYLGKGQENTDFMEDIFDESGKAAMAKMTEGSILLAENLRKYPGEERCDNEFAKELASLGDIYVNEAFSASHRGHASVVNLPRLLPAYAGIHFLEEMNELSKAFERKKPLLFIIGGAKFETKAPFIEEFLSFADAVFVGGAIANNLFKAKGFEVGKSLVSKADFDVSELLSNKKMILPVDVEVRDGEGTLVRNPDRVAKDEAILDAGPKTMETLKKLVDGARLVVWNGPLGNYEVGFKKHTGELAKMIAKSAAHSIVGGGDTILAISELGLEEDFDFVSTAGGAMIQFLANHTLPGIEALKNSA